MVTNYSFLNALIVTLNIDRSNHFSQKVIARKLVSTASLNLSINLTPTTAASLFLIPFAAFGTLIALWIKWGTHFALKVRYFAGRTSFSSFAVPLWTTFSINSTTDRSLCNFKGAIIWHFPIRLGNFLILISSISIVIQYQSYAGLTIKIVLIPVKFVQNSLLPLSEMIFGKFKQIMIIPKLASLTNYSAPKVAFNLHFQEFF